MDPVTLAIAKNRLGLVSVKDFGARGDGETDDTDAFVTAAQVGKHIYVPEGEYVIDATLDEDDLNIEGGGTIVGTLTLTGERLTVRNLNFQGTLRLDHAGRIRVHDVTIDATGRDYGIESLNSYWLSVDGCTVRNADVANIHIQQRNVSATSIRNCTISHSGGNGIQFVRGGSGGIDPESIGQTISGNTIVHNGGYGLAIDGTHDNLITSNTFERNSAGGIRNSRIVETTISANWFEYNRGSETVPPEEQGSIVLMLSDTSTVSTIVGVAVISANQTQGERRVISLHGVDGTPHVIACHGNLIGGNPDAGPAIDIRDYNEAYQINITSNTLSMPKRSGSYTSGNAIRISGPAGTNANGVWVSGNRIAYWGTALDIIGVENVTFDHNYVLASQHALGTIKLSAEASVDVRYNRFRDCVLVMQANRTYTALGNEGLEDE